MGQEEGLEKTTPPQCLEIIENGTNISCIPGNAENICQKRENIAEVIQLWKTA